VSELVELVKELRVQLIGPVRQEILSRIKSYEQFMKLRDHLRPFPDLELTIRDFESAAEFHNLCRGKGIQGSNTDFLVCAVAVRRRMPIFTTDADFTLFQQYLPIKLHHPRTD
jgi:predicted nucleic acid-binding protein